MQSLWIQKLRKLNVNLVQKEYGPRSDVGKKSKTPVMGGVVFLISVPVSILLAVFLTDCSVSSLVLIWILPVASAAIGLCDDLMKFTSRSSEGLSSRNKLVIQVMVSLVWAIFVVFSHGFRLWPGYELSSKILSIIFLSFITVGMMNSVNVTDGLDGLASGASVISFFAVLLIDLMAPEIILPCLAGIAITTSFLWHNAHPAKVFMGDVGSHFLGGLLVSLTVYGNFGLMIIPVAFIFGMEMLSVCLQLIAIYGFKTRIFLMSPVHHHFELSGWSENQIVVRFWLVHGMGILLTSLVLVRFIFH
jgi:phospho-N-acetylmuramoyl-pentapeptide-transferase